ncbi:response regulator transcription factor [Clostridium sp. BJN0001]|uniref:response regulator transcription factor n=1 Tax=Clostridium sp. BJN0001 TaxID=2930219 RepID=UPI001FD47885|nr:response regulator transcription factor [Clostridium sp. BJN0001]
MSNILAVDDDEAILKIIKKSLSKEGHTVDTVSNPLTISESDYLKYDIILLDIMMPKIDGYSLCKRIRDAVDCSIIFLTAKSMEDDITKGLNIGADDYIIKPFGINELRARVNAHLRREKRTKKNAFSISNVKFFLSSKEVYYNGEMIDFTKSEYKICEILAMNHGQVFSKEKIYESVFGFDGESDVSAIVEHIKNIRSKFKRFNINPIKTVWGIGYKWEEE